MMKTQHTYIIAEAGVNHNGSMELAKQLIDAAAESGADAVKFQTFQADKLVSKRTPKAAYQQITTTKAESQYEMLKKLEIDIESHQLLIGYAEQKGIQFLSTPFDAESVDLLAKQLDLPKLKVSSGDITNAPLLLKLAAAGKPIILSTGMSSLGEVETALAVLAFGFIHPDGNPSVEAFQQAFISNEGRQALKEKVTILHCTSEYPSPFEDVNLKAMNTLQAAFDLPVGLSDHTSGIAVPIAATARGGVVIEKHFTLDRKLPGPDHQASLEPEELKQMVTAIRQVELALGSPVKHPAPSELKNKTVVRKSLVAARAIQRGEPFTEENLTIKRPGDGINPIYYWNWLKKVADKDYEADEAVKP